MKRDFSKFVPFLTRKCGVDFRGRILEIGAGTGYFSRRLSKKVATEGAILAVDIQPEMLDLLTNQMAALHITNVKPVLGTITDPKLPPASVDLVLMVALMFQASLASEQDRPLLVALVLIPLVRIVSLSFPLAPSPVAYRYLLTSIPLVVAGILVARNLGLSPGELGLGLGRSLHQLLIGFLSLPLGAIAYLIVRPAAIRSPVSWPTAVVIAVVLVVTTGFVEEFIYRGVLQTASRRVLGHWGLVYASTVSAAVYIGYRSVSSG